MESDKDNLQNTDFMRLQAIVYSRFWDTCSRKEQLEKNEKWESFKLEIRHKIGKNEVGKFGPKMESRGFSQKVQAEVGKYNRSWKVLILLGKSQQNWKTIIEVGKVNRTWKIKLI